MRYILVRKRGRMIGKDVWAAYIVDRLHALSYVDTDKLSADDIDLLVTLLKGMVGDIQRDAVNFGQRSSPISRDSLCITTEEAGELLGCHRSTVARAAAQLGVGIMHSGWRMLSPSDVHEVSKRIGDEVSLEEAQNWARVLKREREHDRT